jgi:hypothetical protein
MTTYSTAFMGIDRVEYDDSIFPNFWSLKTLEYLSLKEKLTL